MLKKVSGRKISKELLERIEAGTTVYNYPDAEENPCLNYCDAHCGVKEGTDASQKSGQDFYQM